MAVVSSTVLAVASIATSVIGAGVAVYGQQQQKKAARRAAEFNAKVKENEALNADLEARERISRKRTQNRRILAAQRAKLAASGVTFAGSPLEVLGDNAATLELETFDISRQAENRRRSLLDQAKQGRAAGEARADALDIASASTILSTGTNVAGSVVNFRNQGVF